jgi:cobalt-zinc-cadmium efflux system outer membrane protein
LALALAGAGFAFAPALQARDLTLEQAVSRSLGRSAVLQAEGAAVTATRYQAELDALAPPLTIGMELENVAGTGDLSGTDSAETTLRLGRVFELGQKHTARESCDYPRGIVWIKWLGTHADYDAISVTEVEHGN